MRAMNTRDEFLTNNDPILKRELEQTRKKAAHGEGVEHHRGPGALKLKGVVKRVRG